MIYDDLMLLQNRPIDDFIGKWGKSAAFAPILQRPAMRLDLKGCSSRMTCRCICRRPIMLGNNRRGFALMDPLRQREIARKGGKAAHEKGTAHQFTSDEAREAGRKGGMIVSRHREHMVEIGRSGGRARRRKSSSSTSTSQPGSASNMQRNAPEASETADVSGAAS
jgi:hypothetical protein